MKFRCNLKEFVTAYRDYDPIRQLHGVTHNDLFGGVNPPIIDSITFQQDPVFMEQYFKGMFGPEDDHYVYARFAHPNTEFLGCQISAIEDATWTGILSSGQAAMSTVVNALTEVGDVILSSSRLYGGTVNMLRSLNDWRKITVKFVDVTDLAAVGHALEHEHPRVFIVESVSNPSVVSADIPAIAVLAKRLGVFTVCDNTFMPLAVLPLRLGVDAVVHSLRKYLSGNSDGLGGSISLARGLPAEVKARIRQHVGLHGPVLHYRFAADISKRMADLSGRVRESSSIARCIAGEFVKKGFHTYAPMLSRQYAQNAVLKKILLTEKFGRGSVIAVDFETVPRAIEFVRQQAKQSAGYSAVSLGSSHTYACAPFTSVSSGSSDGPKELTPSLVRIAIGRDLPAALLWEKFAKV